MLQYYFMERLLSDLSTGDKITALLAVVAEPITKRQIIEFLQIDEQEAGIPEFEAFLAPYRIKSGEIPSTEQSDEDMFFILPDKQAAALLAINVDVKSVHQQIVNVIQSKLGPRNNPQ